MAKPEKQPDRDAPPPHGGRPPAPDDARQQQETQPAEEWGERLSTGRTIARGGKSSGEVEGATEK